MILLTETIQKRIKYCDERIKVLREKVDHIEEAKDKKVIAFMQPDHMPDQKQQKAWIWICFFFTLKKIP